MTEKQKLQKKGGAVFPRVPLDAALGYAKKLVSKTHVAPQPASVIFPGVFGATGAAGRNRSSALKLYGLMEGATEALNATSLAKKLSMAPADELPALLSEACLRPKVFKALYDTFHGDEVSPAKLKQRANAAGVHPDLTESCVDTFIKSIVFAQLGSLSGDSVSIKAVTGQVAPDVDDDDTESELSDTSQDKPSNDDPKDDVDDTQEETNKASSGMPSARSVIQVNITLDSSMDIEKLEKQLALLRKYGAV